MTTLAPRTPVAIAVPAYGLTLVFPQTGWVVWIAVIAVFVRVRCHTTKRSAP